ncbi:uncharacterized protein LOC117653074 [Thrips palmi]|uniref:Uncharacterized protein LOC117653074 n=1 Tax=Thrips palmi TaxID=161013 RepID=A0A6P9AA09_THRPL|nr:uncharacterized protein LOC117653074 [Thrips palmi]
MWMLLLALLVLRAGQCVVRGQCLEAEDGLQKDGLLLHGDAVVTGLRIVNSCSSAAVARKALLGAFVNLDCKRRYPLGVLTGEALSSAESVSELCSGLTQALWVLPESPEPEPQLANALGTLLAAGSWPAADLLTSSVHQDGDEEDGEHHLDAAELLADQALENARLRGVCARRGHAPDGFAWSGPTSRARVLVGVEAALRRMLRDHVLVPVEAPTPQLILAPPDGVWSGATPLPRDALLLVPDVTPLRAMLSRLSEHKAANATDAVLLPEPEEVAAAVGMSDFLGVGRALLRAADLLKEGLSAFCGAKAKADVAERRRRAEPVDAVDSTEQSPEEHSTSASDESETEDAEPAEPMEVLEAVETVEAVEVVEDMGDVCGRMPKSAALLEEAAASATFLLLRSPGPGRPLLPLAHYRGGIWTIADDALTKADVEVVDCPLLLASGQVEWVREAWVATVLTVAVLGTMAATAVAFFIASRILAGDILEGSATLSLLLLLSLLVAYGSALPYCVRGGGVDGEGGLALCGLRLLAAPLAHSLLLAVMLGRALMLAACDHDGGLLSHVSGPLQAALCFFTVAVQVALSVQLAVLLTPAECAWLSGPRFLLLLAYDMLLLVLLAATAPFICTSRRNYREGMFFAATTAVLVAVWLAWLCLYAVGGHAWRDAAVGGGVTACATAVLLGVFIPRTYLMAGAMVRDKLAAQLPALARDASITDLAFREAARGATALTGASGMSVDANNRHRLGESHKERQIKERRRKIKNIPKCHTK